MKRINLFLLASLVYVAAFSQNKTMSINWKAGETKQISMIFSGKEIEHDKVGLDTSFAFEGELLVKNELPNEYIISMNEMNMLESAGSIFYKNLPQEISVTSLVSEISIDKNAFTVTQLNQADYNASIQKSYDEILKILAEKVPEKLDKATQTLTDIKKGQQQNSTTSQIVELILDSYKFNYSEKDTIFADDPGSNPMKLPGFPGAKVMTYVQPSGKKGTSNIVIERIYNSDLYKNMMSGVTQQVSGAIGNIADTNDDSAVKNQMEEAMKQMMSMMDINISDKTVVTRSETSNWPSKITKDINMNMMAGGSKSGAIISVDMAIR